MESPSKHSGHNMILSERKIRLRRSKSFDDKGMKSMLLLPRAKKVNMIEKVHGRKSGAHVGLNKTLARIREKYY